jgi:hypothetical protein
MTILGFFTVCFFVLGLRRFYRHARPWVQQWRRYGWRGWLIRIAG